MRFIRSSTLQDFCLQVIAGNINKFIYNENVPKHQINCLLRVYAEELLQFVKHNNTLTEDIMLWFLNPFNKTVRLCILSEKITKQLQAIGSTITSIDLGNSFKHITENMINTVICCIPNVVYLDLRKSWCSNETLLHVRKKCPALSTLILSSCLISNKGMFNLCGGNLSLKTLNLCETSVNDEGLYIILRGMPSLENLIQYDMAESLFTIHQWDLLKNKNICYNLKELILDSSSRSLDVVQSWTIMCPNVTKVHINSPTSRKMCKICTKFQHLTDLKIRLGAMGDEHDEYIYSEDEFESDEDVSKEDIKDATHLKYIDCTDILYLFLVKARTLTDLNLSHADINPEILINCFVNLKTLCLTDVVFEEFNEINVKENKLEELTIRNLNLVVPSNYSALCVLLSISVNVNKLTLNAFNHTPLEIFDIALNSMKSLSFVDFSFTSINFQYIRSFCKIASMKEIIVEYCDQISKTELEEFKQFEQTECTLSWRCNVIDESNSDCDEDEFFPTLLNRFTFEL